LKNKKNLMSRSEKLRYIRTGPELFPIMDEQYTELLGQVFQTISGGAESKFFQKITDWDHSLRYRLIARFVPLQTAEMIHLLQSSIQEENDGDHTISEVGEETVQDIAFSLFERGRELMKLDRRLEAASTAFAILMAVEPELCNVYDEGFLKQPLRSSIWPLLYFKAGKRTTAIMMMIGRQ
jgi:hypothetical protein